MKTIISIIIISASAFACGGYPSYFFSVGPLLHWNFGKETRFSVGIEASYWQMDGFSDNGFIPVGFDLGVEYQGKDKVTRLYSEVQLSLIYGGISIGPGVEFKNQNSTMFMQGSLWGGLVGYADIRVRKVEGETYICPGIMAKYPFLLE